MRPVVGISSHLMRFRRYPRLVAGLPDRITPAFVPPRSPLSNVSYGQFHTLPTLRNAATAIANQAKSENRISNVLPSDNSESKTIDSVADDLIRQFSSGSRLRVGRYSNQNGPDVLPKPVLPLPMPQRQSMPAWVKSDFDKLLLEQRDVESVLNLAQAFIDKLNMSPQRAVSVLMVLMKMTNQEKSSSPAEVNNEVDLRGYIRSHATFDKLMQVLKEGGCQLSHPVLMASLEAALTIGMSASHPAVESLQNELLWRARKLTPHLLIKVAALQVSLIMTLCLPHAIGLPACLNCAVSCILCSQDSAIAVFSDGFLKKVRNATGILFKYFKFSGFRLRKTMSDNCFFFLYSLPIVTPKVSGNYSFERNSFRVALYKRPTPWRNTIFVRGTVCRNLRKFYAGGMR